MQITENCIVNGMPEKLYHSDPTPALVGFAQSASFSSSMANSLIEDTEEEAMMDSHRLNPRPEDEPEVDPTDSKNFGTMAHSFILRDGQKTFEIVPVKDWRTDEAKAQKASIISRGLIPLNNTTADRVLNDIKTMRQRLREQLDGHRDFPGLMMKGRGEQSGFAFDGQIWNRARFDWLDENYPDIIVDYKTTGISFNKWEQNQLWSEGKYIQSPHYRKTYKLITGREAQFIFVVQQVKAPFHVKIITLDKSYDEEINNRYDFSRRRFINCLKTGVWRGQPPYLAHSCPPPWVLNRWENDALDEKAEKIQATVPTDIAMAG